MPSCSCCLSAPCPLKLSNQLVATARPALPMQVALALEVTSYWLDLVDRAPAYFLVLPVHVQSLVTMPKLCQTPGQRASYAAVLCRCTWRLHAWRLMSLLNNCRNAICVNNLNRTSCSHGHSHAHVYEYKSIWCR